MLVVVGGARQSSKSMISWMAVALLVSLSFNVYNVMHYFQPRCYIDQVPSIYAGLYRNVPTEILKHADYDSPNRTIENAAWDNPDLLPEHGFIALDDSWAAAKGLPATQRWPWDNTKGIYILTSSHELHCVRVLRESVNQAHDALPQSWPHSHILHCLDILRESVMCNADDTPLYTGRLHNETYAAHPKAGIGSIKMCRSWSKLQAFASEHSACWARVGLDDPAFSEIERFKFCPDGSRPWEGQPSLGVYEKGD